MISKKLIALFTVVAFAAIIAAGSAMANEGQGNATSTQQRNGGSDIKGMGLGIGNIMKNSGGNSGDQVARIQAMIQQLQEQLAKLTGGNGSATTTTSAADLGCAKTAVATREAAVAAALTTVNNCQTTALSARSAALATAWDIATNKDRNTAINKAWQDFDKAGKACRDAYQKTDKAAWDAFKAAVKTCKVNDYEGMRGSKDFNFQF